jgi:hypothetical protein
MCKQFFFDDLSSPHVPHAGGASVDESGLRDTAVQSTLFSSMGLRDSRAGGLAMRLGV